MSLNAAIPAGSAPRQVATANGFLPLGILIFTICLMHITRNLSVAYFGLWALSGVGALFIVLRTPAHEKMRDGAALALLGAYAVVIASSLFWSQDYGNPATGIARLMFIFPAVIAMIYTLNVKTFPAYYTVWLIFGVASALSLPAQYALGPISWFAESSERAGAERFGSLAGSLTTYGNLVGALIFVALVRKGSVAVGALLTLCLIAGALASFQKAAFGSVAIGLVSAMVAARIRFSTFASLLIAGGLAFWAIYSFVDDFTRNIVVAYIENIVGVGDASRASDVSIQDSAIDRFTELPLTAIRFFGLGSLFTGVGVFGGSGSLGYPNLPHTHNLLAETVVVFGGVLGLAIMGGVAWLAFRAGLIVVNPGSAPHRNDVVAAGVYLNLLLPAIFAGALFYHPVSGSMFLCSALYMVFSMAKQREKVALAVSTPGNADRSYEAGRFRL